MEDHVQEQGIIQKPTSSGQPQWWASPSNRAYHGIPPKTEFSNFMGAEHEQATRRRSIPQAPTKLICRHARRHNAKGARSRRGVSRGLV